MRIYQLHGANIIIPTDNLTYFWVDSISIKLSDITKVLVIRFSSIGDIVLTTPVIRCLKMQMHGKTEIHLLTKLKFSKILEANPHISKIHAVDNNLKVVTNHLKLEGYHYVVDLQKNVRSLYVRKQLKTFSFDFNKLNIQKWILVNFNIDLLPDIHLVDRYFEGIKALGVENDGKGIEYFIPKNEEVSVGDKFGLNEEKFIVFAIGAAHKGKKLPIEKIKSVCSKIDFPIIIVGGSEDWADGDVIAEGLKNVINACGELTIHGSASVIKQSALLISHDSGMMHIGSAFKKIIISIWGATVPKFGMYPYLPHNDSVIIEASHLTYRPTSKLGNKDTRRERKTMEEIDVEEIVSAAKKRLNL